MKNQSSIEKYIDFLICEFANEHDLSRGEALAFLEKYGAIEFLNELFDIEHTLSIEDALDDMMIICRENGGIIDEIKSPEK